VKFGGRQPPLKPDPDVIRALAELLTETGLSEIEYAVGEHRIRVARETAGHLNGLTVAYAAPPSPPPTVSASVPVAQPEAPAAPAADAAHPGTVKSPIVGVGYLSPQPGAPHFVRVGDSVTEGQTLMIIEAMKVMNQISAPRAGKVTRIFVEDAEPVEYGAPLMLIE
jgi:acetyl-CoA carboxylase biotin carboxyl carrier protein